MFPNIYLTSTVIHYLLPPLQLKWSKGTPYTLKFSVDHSYVVILEVALMLKVKCWHLYTLRKRLFRKLSPNIWTNIVNCVKIDEYTRLLLTVLVVCLWCILLYSTCLLFIAAVTLSEVTCINFRHNLQPVNSRLVSAVQLVIYRAAGTFQQSHQQPFSCCFLLQQEVSPWTHKAVTAQQHITQGQENAHSVKPK